ncbi:MAG: class I SAM-dependent DNA methyltransferase [Ruminococcus sp.]|nr:class I SAM-dependent DNA methyltransferase [Ruminococcus sp.]
MTDKEQKAAAKEFAKMWAGKGDEKQDTHRFWMGFLQKVLGVANADEHIKFEKPVQYKGHTTYIDAYIPETRVLIEQKSLGIDLDKKEPRHGEMLTPFEQAEQYSQKLPLSEKARYIIVSNFETFRIHDLDKQGFESNYEEIKLCDLEKECHRFGFIIDKNKQMLQREMEISLKAGELVGKLYDAIKKQYNNPENPDTLKALNILCVRLVFCLYAEDAGIFGTHEMFGQYLAKFPASEVRKKLIELFEVLDTKPEDRDPYMDDDLATFPYVNGGLFAEKNIEIPRFNEEIVDLLINKASAGFDWADISPTIFGAVFESTLNPETRRSGGMHYTSIENIHKVIDPLFLNDLTTELETILGGKQINVRTKKLEEFRDKLAGLTFLDPACGSGNFLTETYLSLRRLENRAIAAILGDSIMFADTSSASTVKVGIGQFYGIEINDFAVTVAKTALWIAESQMLHETEKIINKSLDFLPLKSYANITEGNALRIDWESVVPKDKLNYIMGNPPFVGARIMNDAQKSDVFNIFDGVKNNGNLDYVACWYKKAADLMKGTYIRTALVSTNSITQGEQVAILWRTLFEMGVHIDFAHRTFRWDNRGIDEKGKKKKTDDYMAAVHVVIVGFSVAPSTAPKRLFDNGTEKIVRNINGYLVEADDIVIDSRAKPICNIPEIGIGNKPIDDGNYLFTKEEMDEFIKAEPKSKEYFRPWLGSREFINGFSRYCLWLGECSPKELRSMPKCLERVENVKQFRLKSKSAGTVKLAEKPTRFHVENMPKTNYILVPKVSSERRRYVPMGFLTPDTLCSDLVFIIPNATIYHFGVLTSNVHMAWMRAVAGRLKSDYRYSKDIVYNNFPWCSPTPEQKAKIEQTAQAILDARALYPDCSLADLYDELTMPQELRKAHQLNDKAVMQAYGFKPDMPESEIVAELMKMYQKLTEGKIAL